MNQTVYLCGTTRAVDQAFRQWVAGLHVQFVEVEASHAVVCDDGQFMSGCLIIGESISVVEVVQILGRLRDAQSCLQPIVITARADIAFVVRVIRLGALNVVMDDVSADALKSTVDEALALSSQQVAEMNRRKEILYRIDNLSSRQKEVMAYVVQGASNKTIAAELHLSPKTIEVHRASVMRKMKARSLPDLVKFSMTPCSSPRNGIALASQMPTLLPTPTFPDE